MLSLFRNVGQKIVKNQYLLKSMIDTRAIHTQLNVSNSSRNQLQLPYLCGRFYSTDSEKPQNEDETAPKVKRTVPKIVNDEIQIGAPFFGFITNRLKAIQIRNSLDPEFNLNEFVEGSKKAAEVICTQLSNNKCLEMKRRNEFAVIYVGCFR